MTDEAKLIVDGMREGNFTHLANFIASLSAELEQVKRERDAAMKDIPRRCKYCIRKEPLFLADGKMDDICWTCFKNDHCNWQWRGPQEDPHD